MGDEPGTEIEQPFRILAVCTGNICRSPMVERLLVAGLERRFPGQFVVRSAGTAALAGAPIDPRMAGFIRVLGGDADDFRAKQLTPDSVANQDLILALTREHRSRVVEMDPAVLRRTFTLREFARLVSTLQLDDSLRGTDRWRAAVAKALRARSVMVVSAEEDDVVDPHRRSEETYQRAARIIATETDRLLAA